MIISDSLKSVVYSYVEEILQISIYIYIYNNQQIMTKVTSMFIKYAARVL